MAFAIRWALNPWLTDHQPWFTFYLAVALTSWRYGCRAACLAAVLGLAGGIWFLLPPQGDLVFHEVYSWVQVGTYVGVARALAALLGEVRPRQSQEEAIKTALKEDLELLDLTSGLVLNMDERITRWNTGSQRLYGYSSEQALGRSSHELLQTQFPVPLEQVRAELLNEGAWRGELVQRRSDGQEVVVASEWVLHRDGAGQPQAILEVNTNITPRKRAEEALADRNRKLSLLTEAATDLLSVTEPTQALAAFYERIADYLQTCGLCEFELSEDQTELRVKVCRGIGEAEQEGERPRLKLGQGIAGQVAQQRQAIIRSRVQASSRPDESLIRRLGVNAYACFPLTVGERLLGTLSFASHQREEFSEAEQEFFAVLASYVAWAKERRRLSEEIEKHAAHQEQTIQERTAKLNEMMAELRQMSYSMVHEMRAPLRAIVAFTHLLLEQAGDRLDAEARDYLSRIEASAARMDLLVNDALNYNKVLREDLALEPVELEPILLDLVNTLEEFQPPRALVQLKGPFPKVIGNKGLLAQCFSQLLRNAVTYIQPGRQPRVEISADRRDGKIHICFWDNGVGIPKEFQERIFRLFERGYQTEREATGVGLALVHKMITRMHGRVWVESEPEQGSRFHLELPAASN